MSKDIEKIESLKAELSAWHESFGTTQLTHALAERERLKSENARLAAHNAELKTACESIISPIRPHWRTTMELASKAVHVDPTDALRDLLAPTIELLSGLDDIEPDDARRVAIRQELARLRAACGEKDKK